MNTTGKLRFEPLDLAEVHDLDLTHFPHPWTKDQWVGLNPDQNLLLSWRSPTELLGYCLLGIIPGDDVAHLLKILVSPQYQKQGIAYEFWSAIGPSLKAKGLSRVFLEVEASNQAAIRLYEKCGFKHLRRNKGYYSNGEDALTMELML